MRFQRSSSIALFGTVVLLLAPFAARAQAPTGSSAPTLALARAVGSEAVTLTGNAPPNAQLEAALYARFSRDLPTVLLSRRTISADAAGHYSITLPTASAFFREALVVAVVRIPSTGASVAASTLVGAPNVPAPPDEIPPSVR